MNRNTREIIATSYTDDKTRYYWRDEERKKLYEFLKEEFPGREVGFSSATLDYGKFLITVPGDKYASESWFLDAESRDLIHQYTPRPELKKVEEYLAPMEPVRYASSDGLEIPAYLTLPVGKEAENLPTVILVHGGPKGPRDYWGYNSFVQFLANRGYAVLQPNFRASGGFGKNFMNAGDLEWGKLMQDDITWGVKYLVKEGIANPDKVCIMGGSYGGYATLAGLAFTPDVYACGVDIVGPSNIFTLLESIPPYWEAGRAFLHGMVGDPSTEEGKKRITEASPLFSADKINKPLLVIQGANDPRVKKAEADQIVIALRDNGHEVSYLLADDEGHGFAKPVNNMAMFAEIERFLAPIMGGRFQEEMPEDVAKRLEEIRVDITSVEYNPLGEVEVDSVLPPFQLNFNEEKRGYKVEINLGEQNIPMKLIRSYTQNGEEWVVTDKSSSAMGESVDKMTYSLDGKPLHRLIEQQGQEIKVVYNQNAVEVTMKDKVENIEYDGALLVSGPGYEDVMAKMEIPKEGAVLNALDVTSMKMKPVKIKMLDTEMIDDVEYDVILVHDLENENDKTTTWVNKETRAVHKSIQISPQMNNAEIITTRMK
jgi:dienelactone hydrolase